MRDLRFYVKFGGYYFMEVEMGSLQFVLGDANGNHQEAITHLAKEWIKKEKTVYFIVPNNMKYESEVSLLQALSDESEPAAVKVQVFSFSRLAWYLLQSVQEIPNPELSDSGIQMVLRQILRQNENQLRLFRGEMRKIGFIEKLSRLILEFQSSNVSIDDLNKKYENKELNDKIHDFCLVYQKFIEQTSSYSIGANTAIDYLIQHIYRFPLQNTVFIITGFHYFTAQEQTLLQTLMEQSTGIVVDLILDRKYATEIPEKMNLFYSTGMVYHRLYQQALAQKIPVLHDIHTVPSQVSSGIEAMNHNWQVMQAEKKDAVSYGNDVLFWKLSTIQKEVERVAIEIKRLVQEGMQYRDVIVLTRDLPNYQLVIQPIFQSFDIPYNISESQSMTYHPLTVLFESLFGLLKYHFRYRDVMRFLRTELVVPYSDLTIDDENEKIYHQAEKEYRNQVDRTENVMLAFGYEGNAFTSEKDWVYPFEEKTEETLLEQEQVNRIRCWVRDTIIPFKEQLKKADTAAEAAMIFYQFLIQWHVDKQIINWRDCAQREGNLLDARIQEQTWGTFVQLLDDYVELMGDQPFDIDEFEDVLMQGMTAATYSHVPTTLDQVAVMDLVRAPYNRQKVVFVIGATSSNMPHKIENDTLLSDEDRQLIDQSLQTTSSDKFLTQNTSLRVANEPLFAYIAMMRATEKLYITYPQDHEIYEKEDLSPYVKTLIELGGSSLSYEEIQRDPAKFNGKYIVTKRQFISELVSLERLSKETQTPLNRNWQSLANIVKKDEKLAPMMIHILSSLEHQNIANPLSTELVEMLYGKTMSASVSRFETFNQCAYRYYLQYGLKLHERTEYALSSAAMGEFFHETLDQFIKELMKETSAVRLANFSEADLINRLNYLMDDLLQQRKYAILQQSKHMIYIRQKLKHIIQRVVWAMHHQSQYNQSHIYYTELLFGNIHGKHGLKPLVYHVDHHHQLKIRGKIDRLDLIKSDDKAYMTVVDYKSSMHDFSFQDAYYGLAMQLLTYLDVALTHADSLFQMDVIPAGALYMILKNPVVDWKKALTDEQYDKEMLKQYKQNGILLDDSNFLHQMDQTLEPGQYSSLINVRLKKSGDFQKTNKLLSVDEMKQLLRRNEDNFLNAGASIYQGRVDINPYRYDNQQKACTYCPFRSICQFDPLLKENQYRQLKKLDRQDVMLNLEEDKDDTSET